MKEIIERWKAKEPAFFKKIKHFALSIGGVCVVVLGVQSVPGLQVDDIFVKVISYILVACAAVAGTSQLTKE